MLPQANATLTALGGEEWTADYDRDEADVNKWSGVLDAYFQVKRRRVPTAGGLDVLVERILIIPEGEVAASAAAGDVVSFEFAGTPETGKVREVERRVLSGHPLQTTRLILEDA